MELFKRDPGAVWWQAHDGNRTLLLLLLWLQVHDGSFTPMEQFKRDPEALCSTVTWRDEEDRVVWVLKMQVGQEDAGGARGQGVAGDEDAVLHCDLAGRGGQGGVGAEDAGGARAGWCGC
jgi:hypothetical protein